MHGSPWMRCRELLASQRIDPIQSLVFEVQTTCDLKLPHEVRGDTKSRVRSPDLVEI